MFPLKTEGPSQGPNLRLTYFLNAVKISISTTYLYFLANIIHIKIALFFLNSNPNLLFFSFLRWDRLPFHPCKDPFLHVLQSFYANCTSAISWFCNEIRNYSSVLDFVILLLKTHNTAFPIAPVLFHHFYIPAEVHFNIANMT